MKEHRRMPAEGELPLIGALGQKVSVDRGCDDIEAQLQFLEHVAEFIEREGRFPSDDEMPADPFL
jgi:hypothetical protein